MNKRILHTLCVAALMLTACSSNDTIIEESPNQQPATGEITLTATLAPKGDGSGTRAITTGTDGGKEILNVAWEVGEQIAIRYQTGETTYATTIATVKSVDATTHVATIEATITGAIDGGTVNFVYPASLANDTGDDIDESKLLKQNGNLIGANGISTKFDAATGDGKIHLNSGTTLPATVTNTAGTGNVTMTNRVCICKFHFDIVESAGTGSSTSGVYEHTFSPIIILDGNGHTYTITSDKKDDYGIGTRGFKKSDDIYIALLPVSGKSVSFYNCSLGTSGYDNYKFTSSNTTLTAGKFYRNLSIDMVKTTTQFKFRDLSAGNITATTGDFIYSSGQTANTITIADGATVTLGGVNISATGSAGIICSGDATINLEGTNCVKGGSLKAGISVPSGKTLTISGDGSLTATGDFAAGIGGNSETSCGSINITGGTVTAAGGRLAAGIGSADNASCSNISISGSANVMATGGGYGAGIGSGCANNISNSCGAITISGSAHVTATGGEYAAGIGSGYANLDKNTCSDITIIGSANVTATGGDFGAGIGSGYAKLDKNICGNITINGLANVTATGGTFGAGIGSGCGNYDNNIYVSSCGAISIEGGTVSAIINTYSAAGIGSTSYGKFASINITSGITSVTATRNTNLNIPPIGKGDDDQGSGSITIDGQTISDAMTKGTEALPTFTNLNVVISDTPYTNSTWTITKK